ncbi:hypothetical protein Agabi119p4_9662 [Agaricus bisporus var. burnettii]|uniref:Uncharacterized protein n=1 Tax=Agaricus bisporus var. burnettii TaxID=192524 RepID=A0A8H7C468_AGABI|nr:hypothetical protein Agabi119p4_9662 [Agaricus bisporus var. burnettii]
MPAPPSPKRPRTGSRVPSTSLPHEFPVLHPLPDNDPVSPRPAASNTSSNTSSEIARNRHMFDQAMIANNFVYEEARFKDVMLTRIYDNVKFPTTVNDHEFTQWCFRVTGHYIAFDDDSLSPEDPYDLAHMKFVILSLWQDYMCAFSAHKSDLIVEAADWLHSA